MFFVFSKILGFLIQPLVWVLFLMLLSLFLKKEKLKKQLAICSVVVLYSLSNPFLFNLASRFWEVPAVVLTEKHDAAVVLLGFTSLMKEPMDRVHVNQAVNRLTQIMPLYNSGVFTKFVLAGGSSSLYEKEKSEAEESKKLLLNWGVSEDDIEIEGKSRNTYENLRNAKAHLQQYDKVILVTSASHMRRALACSEKLGINMIPYPTDFRTSDKDVFYQNFIPDSSALKGFHALFHEWVGYAAYKVRGYC